MERVNGLVSEVSECEEPRTATLVPKLGTAFGFPSSASRFLNPEGPDTQLLRTIGPQSRNKHVP